MDHQAITPLSLLNSLREEWICPITRNDPQQPAVSSQGNTYDREALDIWLLENNKDPITNAVLKFTKSIPNHTLKKVIHKLEKQLPQLQFQMAQKDLLINNLQEGISLIKCQLQEHIQQSQTEQRLSQARQEYITKTKGIQKRNFESQKIKLQKITQLTKECTTNRRLIQQMTVKQMQDQIKLKEQMRLLDRKDEKIDELAKIIAISDHDFDRQWELNETLKKQFIKCVNQTNFMIQFGGQYRAKMFSKFEDLYQNNREMANVDARVEKPNIRLQVHEYMMKSLQIQRYQKATKALSYEEQRNRINSLYGRKLNEARMMNLTHKFNLNSMYQMCQTEVNIDLQQRYVQFGYALSIIPFSIPPTKEELQIDWSFIVKIHLGKDHPISNQLWEIFINNVSNFPQLKQLIIEKSNKLKIKQVDLKKMRKISRIRFRNTSNFGAEVLEELRRFKANNPIVQVTQQMIMMDIDSD